MNKEIYLDNSATTKVLPEVVKAVVNSLENNYGNPSSLHRKGFEAEKTLNNTRKLLADYLQVKPEELIFTSGGTESNNLAVRGIIKAYQQRGKHIITSTIEHSSIDNLFKALEKEGWDVDRVPVNEQGYINLETLRSLIREDTVLVSIMHVNNELGTIQEVKKIAELVKEENPLCFFHSDGVQAAAKVYVNLKEWPIDLYSISGHKIHAPKGTGVLYIRKAIELKSLFYGGGQEQNIRSGTENIPGIAGLGAAVKKLPQLSPKIDRDQKINELRNYLWQALDEIEGLVINSPASGAPQIINFSIPGIRGETMLHALESQGIYLSTGSACSSKEKGSRIINACGLPQKLTESVMRVSLNQKNTKAELDYFIKTLKEQIDFLKLF